MKAKVLTDYIEKYKDLNKNDFNEIKKILEEFPYFQTAHLLYVKSANNIKSSKFNNIITKSSAFITDREMLYKLLTNKIDNIDTYAENKPQNRAETKPVIRRTIIKKDKTNEAKPVEKAEPVEKTIQVSENKIADDKKITEENKKQVREVKKTVQKKVTHRRTPKPKEDDNELLTEYGKKRHENLITDIISPKIKSKIAPLSWWVARSVRGNSL